MRPVKSRMPDRSATTARILAGHTGFEPVIYGATSRRELLASPMPPLYCCFRIDHLLKRRQFCRLANLVGSEGVEPSRLAAPVSETGASPSSARSPYFVHQTRATKNPGPLARQPGFDVNRYVGGARPACTSPVLPRTPRMRPDPRGPARAARARSRRSATWPIFRDMPSIQAQLSPTRNGPLVVAPDSIDPFLPSSLLATNHFTYPAWGAH